MTMTESQTDQQQQPEEENKTAGRPIASFEGTGNLQVAVWKHKNEGTPDNYSAKISRSYKDKDGEYQTTDYLRDSDLLRVNSLLEQADQWIEQDKGRRVSQAGQSR